MPVEGNKFIVTPTFINSWSNISVERETKVYFLKPEISFWQIAKTRINKEKTIIKTKIMVTIPYSSPIDAKT